MPGTTTYGPTPVYVRKIQLDYDDKEDFPPECTHIAYDWDSNLVAVFESEELALEKLNENGFMPQRLN